jgi:hypothetical protein
MGKKTPKDLSICQKTFQNITKEEWIRMCGIEGNAVAPEVNKQPTPEELRALRLARFDNA